MGLGLGNKYTERRLHTLNCNICNNAVRAISAIKMTLATGRVLANANDVSLLLLAGQLPMNKYIL